MRDYSRFYSRFWIGETGRTLKKLGPQYQIAAMYLFTSPHSNMIGLYYLPISLMAHETGLGDDCESVFDKLCKIGFCSYDHKTEIVWVHEACRFQLSDALGTKDKQCVCAAKFYNETPNCSLLEQFFNKYGQLIPIQKREGSPCQALMEPLPSPTDTERLATSDKRQATETETDICAPLPSANADIFLVWKYWREKKPTVHKEPGSADRKLIRKKLREYTPEKLCSAIDGMFNDPWEERCNNLELVYAFSDKNISKFIGWAEHPPSKKQVQIQQRLSPHQAGAASIFEYANKLKQEIEEENGTRKIDSAKVYDVLR